MSNAQSVSLGSHSSGPGVNNFADAGSCSPSIDDLIALSNIVIVQPDKEEVSKGGIVIADVGEAQKVRWGTVVKVGPGRFEDGVFIATQLVEGDRVLFGKYASAGEPIKLLGIEYLNFREGDLIAKAKRA